MFLCTAWVDHMPKYTLNASRAISINLPFSATACLSQDKGKLIHTKSS
jgi:hypothetical protein